MGVKDEINVLRLLDQAEPAVGGHDTIDLQGLVTRTNHKEVGGGSNTPVLKKGEPKCLGTVIVTALVEELGELVILGSDDFRDPVVDFAEKHLVSNELFERSGHPCLLSRTAGGTRKPPSAA
jgi:hypothetical protein